MVAKYFNVKETWHPHPLKDNSACFSRPIHLYALEKGEDWERTFVKLATIYTINFIVNQI